MKATCLESGEVKWPRSNEGCHQTSQRAVLRTEFWAKCRTGVKVWSNRQDRVHARQERELSNLQNCPISKGSTHSSQD